MSESYVHLSKDTRTIYLTGEVDAKMASEAMWLLGQLDADDGEINLVINSEGGSEHDGYALYDAIAGCRNKVVATGYGAVMSIMAAVFQAADERRLATNAVFMVHNGTVTGDHTMQQDSVLDLADQIRKDNRRYYRILSHSSGHPVHSIRAFCQEETYFTAEEAVREGFADSVVGSIKKHCVKPKKRSKK